MKLPLLLLLGIVCLVLSVAWNLDASAIDDAGRKVKMASVSLKHHKMSAEQSLEAFAMRFGMAFEELQDFEEGYQLDSDYYNMPVEGNILPQGVYSTVISVGSPPQLFTVGIDTGSNDLIIPLAFCDGCHSSLYNEYIPKLSITSLPVECSPANCNTTYCYSNQCGFLNQYGSCNLTAQGQLCFVQGPLYYDVFGVPGTFLQATTVIGAIQKQAKNFQQLYNVTGVWGLAYEHVWGLYNSTSAFEDLVQQGELEDAYAMCLDAQNGGTLTLGGANSSFYSGEFQYTPIIRKDWFWLNVTSITVGYGDNLYQITGYSTTTPIPGPTGGFILDSGTNAINLLPPGYAQLYYAMVNNCSNNYLYGVCAPSVANYTYSLFNNNCFNYSQVEISMFPQITINLLGDVSLTVSGEDYLVWDESVQAYCFGITGAPGLNVLGDVLMQNYYTLFDRANSRIGFAPVTPACFAATTTATLH